MRSFLNGRIVLIWMAVAFFGALSWAAEDLPEGGLVVRLGCADAQALVALRTSDNLIVHGLEVDPQTVEAVREQIDAIGCYGPVSVGHFDGEHLPYTDNLVNVLIADAAGDVTEREILRVLAPNGVAKIGEKRIVKPWPDDIDDWTHFLHDASGNAVAADRRVAPPRHLQWDGGPRWSRSHETDMSVTALVTTGGRIFHTTDDGPIGIHETPLAQRRFPDKCFLVARDAFNGIELWRRPIPGWGSVAWDKDRWQWGTGDQLWSAPLTLPRRLVAFDDRVFVTLGFRTHISELDAATGKTLREFKETGNAEEFVLSEGILVVRRREARGGDAIVAIDVDPGRVVWETQTGNVADLTLGAAGGRVCFSTREQLVALDLRTGRQLWSAARGGPARRGADAGTVVMHGDVVLSTSAGSLRAHSLTDGTLLWNHPIRGSFRGMPDVCVAGSLAWLGTLTTRGLDPKTGELRREITPGNLFTGGHHVRCYRGKATEEFLLWSKRGIEFLDLVSDRHARHDWVRGTCRYGILPANGLVYAPPHPCFCYPGVKLTGFNALSATDRAMTKDRRIEPQTVKGPAFDDVAEPDAAASNWPTYRGDNARSGRAGVPVPTKLKRSWRTELRGKISPPVAAGGRVFVAGIDTHCVYCLRGEDGERLWSYTAGGPVDSPPTIAAGRVLFGCADGSVYCLRATDGELVWRFQAAPFDKRIMSYERIESAWPIHGSVLVENSVAYFAAGRSSYLDGGMYLFGLDVITGEIRHRAHLAGPQPDLSRSSNRAHEMDGAKNDILVSNGERLFLTQNVFDRQLKQLPTATIAPYGARETDLHLVATGGFLDDSGFDRLFWMHARRWPGLYVAVGASKAGQILVFDESATYGLHVFTHKFSRSPFSNPGEGCTLFADDNDNEPVLNEANARRERGTMSRARPAKWSVNIPVRVRAMVLAGDTLFLAGPPDVVDEDDPLAAIEGRKGALLWAVSTAAGKRLTEYHLDVPPVFDGLIAAGGKLYMTTADSSVTCWEE